MQTQITIDLLREKKACEPGIVYFQKHFHDGITIQEMIDKKCKYQCWLFLNLKLSGKATEYYTNGKVWYECYYENGVKEGKETNYYTNGKVEYERYYENDKLQGKETEYYENGNVRYEYYYKNGEVINPKTTLHNN